ncbi:MAG TPA: hypothetical protein EYP54_10100 [Anaerolineales bacterium]|nr:hypothetical protein [Anaerolineales bacterium]
MHAPRQRKGQSLVEFVLILPLFLLILSGLVEFGFWMLKYSNMVQATRNAARFALDNDYRFIKAQCTPVRTSACDAVCGEDFYCKTALMAINALAQYAPQITLDPATDDVVISVFTLTEGHYVTNRFPDNDGWSYYGTRSSRFTSADVQHLLQTRGVQNTSTGYVLVEVFYNYHQVLGLPWLKAFVPDPLPLHSYTFMPLYSAAPTPTP